MAAETYRHLIEELEAANETEVLKFAAAQLARLARNNTAAAEVIVREGALYKLAPLLNHTNLAVQVRLRACTSTDRVAVQW